MPADIDRLLEIMARLRDPDGGCPWDLAQTFETIAPYTIEEAYEVADAIDGRDMSALKEELGDLLLQVVFHAQMAGEAEAFDFADVVAAICDKMVRRHPHVFGDTTAETAAVQTRAWEEHKANERRAKQPRARPGSGGALDGVPAALPGLLRADKLGRRAARVGFDWPSVGPVFDKIHEEIGEIRAEMAAGAGAERLAHELGDLLFACANLGRHLGVDSETALRRANNRFESRFRRVEELLAERGKASPQEADIDELEELWTIAKAEERQAAGA